MPWLYSALLLFTISFPLAFTWDKRMSFYKKWKPIFTALIIVASFFIVWDFWFTAVGVWKFNPEYVFGIYGYNLPVEEWLFFILVPYACMFIHESLKYFYPVTWFDGKGKIIAFPLIAILLMVGGIYYNHLYTSVTFFLLAVFLTLNISVFKSHFFLGRFFLTYLVSTIGFLIVNGFLTAMPVLIYNEAENLGVRVGTIPLEDFFYSMLMLLMNITIYEHLLRKANHS